MPRQILLLAPLVLAACYATPERDDPRVAATLQRLLAADLSHSGFATRAAGVEHAQAGLRSELGRLDRWSESPVRLARSQHTAETAPQRLRELAAAEGERLGRLPQAAQAFLPGPEAATSNLAQGLDTVPDALRLDRPPLDEPSDRAHRTDPRDVRPEATLWQRIWRRLPF